MMLFISGGSVVDPASGLNERSNILVRDGKVAEIGLDVRCPEGARKIDATGLTVAPGFVDIHCHFRDPGFTYKEDIHTGALCAAAGGFTTVVCMANTSPAMDSPELVREFASKAAAEKIEVLTVGAITRGLAGKELVDMKALLDAGAVGFSDDGKPLMDAALVLRAMRAAREAMVPLSFHEEDPSLIEANGVNATSPHTAEDVLVARDIELALATGAKVNIQHLSSAASVELLRQGKRRGASVFAEVTPHHFSLTEDALRQFGPNAKMNPPLRTEADRQALIEGLAYGTIDCIATDHAPHAAHEKDVALEKAMSGIIGLETAFALAVTNLVAPGRLSLSELVRKMSLNPARLYGFDRGALARGKRADIVVFDPEEEWTVSGTLSKSNNSPFMGSRLKGKVKYTVSGGAIVYEG